MEDDQFAARKANLRKDKVQLPSVGVFLHPPRMVS
jgi:hypothetical protein